MSDPDRPQWEDCKVCGGDHWTKDHAPSTDCVAYRSTSINWITLCTDCGQRRVSHPATPFRFTAGTHGAGESCDCDPPVHRAVSVVAAYEGDPE